MKSLIISLLLLTTYSGYTSDGWLITTRYYNALENPANARLEQVYLSGNFMKMVTGDLSTIFDIAKSEIIYINNSNQTYWKGNPERFNLEVKAELELMIEQKLYGLEHDQQQAMRAMYKEMLNASFPESGDAEVESRNFSVKKGQDGKVISGFKTIAYNVFEDGMPLESLWIATDLQIAKDFDFVNLSNFLNQMARGAYAASFESSKEYFDLLEIGYPVKVEMTKSDGYTYVSEVVEAKKIPIAASEFALPKGFSAGTLTDVGVWSGL